MQFVLFSFFLIAVSQINEVAALGMNGKVVGKRLVEGALPPVGEIVDGVGEFLRGKMGGGKIEDGNCSVFRTV